jgi:hypothetical protein
MYLDEESFDFRHFTTRFCIPEFAFLFPKLFFENNEMKPSFILS